MKKKIALGIVGVVVTLVVGVAVAASMQPDSFRVERSRVISAPPSTILPQLENLERWAEWNPWSDLDPNQQTRFSDPASGVDAWYEWEGNDDVGKGRMTIVSASAEEVTYELEFIEPFESKADVGLSLAEEGDGTRVTWWMSGDNDFMGKLFSLFMDFEGAIEADFDRGLERLDRAVTSAT